MTSPATLTFIAYNYNTPVDVRAFEKEAKRILREVEENARLDVRDLASTVFNRDEAKINYAVWSDVFRCRTAAEVVFWDVALDKAANAIKDTWACLACGSLLSKRPSKGSGSLRSGTSDGYRI